MDGKFHLGLTMAGAVSAGAYTGGVLDYLIQTLDAWHASKDSHDPTVPTHELSIDIISGASAGGITGAMAALTVHKENRNPVVPSKRDDEKYLKENVFYNAWVNLSKDNMVPELLSDSDINNSGKIVSLLNSKFIEEIAARTIVCVPECTDAPPRYVSKRMELVLTLSNLDGFTYELSFAGEGSSKHTMKQHRDYAFFRLGDQYGGDGRIPLNLQQKNTGLEELVQAAPATGAFPVGLAYRKFVRKKKYILDNPDLVFFKQGITTLKDISNSNPDEDYVTYNVDGGMLNNEPFDLTMKLMERAIGSSEEQSERNFNSTIIMIDPFPSDDSVVAEPTSTQASVAEQVGPVKIFKQFPYSMLEAMGKVFSSMRGELLFKGEDIVKAFSNEDFSRFMIAPRRRSADGTVYNGSVAIACGALGGFAGFLDKSFRKHDFYLGRANCQSFLRKYFRVRLENNRPVNPLFASGYSDAAVQRFRFQDPLEREAKRKRGEDPESANWYVPIIPDVYLGKVEYDEVPPVYPKYDMSSLDQYKGQILKRFKQVARSFSSKWWYRPLVGVGFLLFGNKLYRQLRDVIQKQFKEWKLN